MGLVSALTPALEEAGLSTSVSIVHDGDHEETEYRSGEEAVRLGREAAQAVIYELSIYLPPAAIAFGLERLADRIEAAFWKWRRDRGQPGLKVPIYGPDGKTIIRTVAAERPPSQ